jgi:hypothetical protein
MRFSQFFFIALLILSVAVGAFVLIQKRLDRYGANLDVDVGGFDLDLSRLDQGDDTEENSPVDGGSPSGLVPPVLGTEPETTPSQPPVMAQVLSIDFEYPKQLFFTNSFLIPTDNENELAYNVGDLVSIVAVGEGDSISFAWEYQGFVSEPLLVANIGSADVFGGDVAAYAQQSAADAESSQSASGLSTTIIDIVEDGVPGTRFSINSSSGLPTSWIQDLYQVGDQVVSVSYSFSPIIASAVANAEGFLGYEQIAFEYIMQQAILSGLVLSVE